MQTPVFYLSLVAFLISLGSGIYFFGWWIKSGARHPFLLFWACGLGFLLLFKIPNILANVKVKIVQENFYPFFFVTLLLYFFAYFAIIYGFTFFTRFSHRKFIAAGFALWFGIAIFYFASSFLIPKIGVANAPVWVGHLLFYIPAQLLLFYVLWRVTKRSAKPFTDFNLGALLTAAGIFSLFLSSVFYIITQTESYSKEFWYFSVISSSEISFLQIISGLLLFFGLRAFAKSYLKIVGQ